MLPRRDLQRLPPHFVELVGEHLKRDGFVLNGAQNVPREFLVVLDVCLFHQRGIGGYTLDQWVGVEAEHCCFVRAVGKDFYSESLQRFFHG